MIAYPNTGMLWGAGLLQTALAGSKIRLFQDGQGINVGPALTLAELEAAECDFTGYTEATIANWLAPLLNPVGGASTDSGSVQFAISAPYTVSNVVGGGWVETAGGVLVAAWNYDPVRPVLGAGDGISVDLFLIFG